MKNARKISKLLIFTTVFLVSILTLFSEDDANEMAAYDAIAAAPDHHRVIFENEKVRVLEVTIKPGEKEPFHVHPMPSVMTVIAGAKLRITEATLNDGKLVPGKTIEVGKDNFQPPPLWMPPQGLRSVENIGSVKYHSYQIELKNAEKAKAD
jgi:predicted metal-dependent enzyme (double-stranded beta helix superfamily)